MKGFFKTRYLLSILCFIASGCQRELQWDLVSATGSLQNPAGTCMPQKTYGTFIKNVPPGKDTAYIELKVNVFTTGTYSIFTDTQNGLRFADSGILNSRELQVIKLKPAGRPAQAGIIKFTVCFGNSCCPVSIAIKDEVQNDILPVNSWRYTDTEKRITYRSVINATHLLVTPLSALLALRKEVIGTSDTSFEIGLSFPTKQVTPGIYTTDSINAMSLSTNGICVNCAWQIPYKFYSVLTTIRVTEYDVQTKHIKGTFAGTTIDWNYPVSPIRDGEFNAIIR